ncbi:MAG: alpha/beta hydrolase [Verrucomicrobia bacterium]|nr:alpha/beta hydrolase [Verrucomicrobiota bacterium]
MRKFHCLVALMFGVLQALSAAEPSAVLLWPQGAPGSEGKAGPEKVEVSKGGERNVSNIHAPSLTPFLPPKDRANGAAVIVVPGGGHRVLCVDHEGYNIARWLNERGIAAFVLKHRLAREAGSTYKIEVEADADMRRALRLVRHNAKAWAVDPGRVGAIGFSAGGELVSHASIRFDAGAPDAADHIERERSRPDFQGLIYPGRSTDILPTTNAPPAFLACGYNDRQDIAEGLAEAYLRFKRAGVPAELHIYSAAGHGFGMRAGMKGAVAGWATRFEEWMQDRGFLTPP